MRLSAIPTFIFFFIRDYKNSIMNYIIFLGVKEAQLMACTLDFSIGRIFIEFRVDTNLDTLDTFFFGAKSSSEIWPFGS